MQFEDRWGWGPAYHAALVAACVGWIAVLWLWRPAIFTMPVDDSFYYLVTAKNVAAGAGPTFDRISQTNGFHPLWLALLAGLFSLVRIPMDALVRLVLSLQVAMVYAGTRLLSRVPSLGGARLQAVMALLLVNPYCAKILVNCQESAIQYLLLAVVLWCWWRIECRSGSVGPLWHLGIGMLAGFVVLARLEALFFAAAVTVMPVLWPSTAELNERFGRRLVLSFSRTTGVFVVVAPYLAWNVLKFGHLLPISGAIKHEDGGSLASGWIALVGAAAVAILFAFRVVGKRLGGAEGGLTIHLVFPLLAYVTLVEAYHVAFRTAAGLSNIRVWYLVPHLMLAAAAICVGIGSIHGGRFRIVVAAGLTILVLAVTVPAWLYRTDPRSYAAYEQEAEAGEWLRSHAGAGAVIAGWDVGYLSGFSGLRVIALDGLINSWEFKERYLDPGNVEEFVTRAYPVDYIAQSIRPQTIAELAAGLWREQRDGVGSRESASVRPGRWPSDLSRWTPALLGFTVVRSREFEARFAYRPRSVVKGMLFLVLSRRPQSGLPTLAQFVLRVRECREGHPRDGRIAGPPSGPETGSAATDGAHGSSHQER